MSYQFIENLQGKTIPVSHACFLLEVSRLGYHARAKRHRTAPVVCGASVYLRTAFTASGRTYGSRQAARCTEHERYDDGAPQGTQLDASQRAPLGLEAQLRAYHRQHAYHASVTQYANPPVRETAAQRSLGQRHHIHSHPQRPTVLAAVLDLHSGKNVGWAMAPEMPATLVCAALQVAIVQRNPAAVLVVHSDPGTQYASAQHQAVLQKRSLIGSMSRKGNCSDNNAVVERFFLNLKMERIWQQDYANHSGAMTDVADYIVGFYNCTRLHSKLGNLSPNAFERQSATQPPIEVSKIT